MKAQTAIALVIAFAAVFLFVGFYGYADPNGAVCIDDSTCDSGHCSGGTCVECILDNDCPGGFSCQSGSCSPSGSSCGNGGVEPGEQCDNGVNNGACPATCSTSCVTNDCGGAPPGGGLTANPSSVTAPVSTTNWQVVMISGGTSPYSIKTRPDPNKVNIGFTNANTGRLEILGLQPSDVTAEIQDSSSPAKTVSIRIVVPCTTAGQTLCSDGTCRTTCPSGTGSVAVAKTGTGTVTSNPSGINCGSTCSFTFTSGASVTLTANPSTGVFSGDCSGTGTCTLTTGTSGKNVAVNFTATTINGCAPNSASNDGLPCVPSGCPDYRGQMGGAFPKRFDRIAADTRYSPGFDAAWHVQCMNPSAPGALQTLYNTLSSDISSGIVTKCTSSDNIRMSNGRIWLCSDEADSYITIQGGSWIWDSILLGGCNNNGVKDNGETGVDCGGGGCAACGGDDGDHEVAIPVITSVSPNPVGKGSNVEIRGTNLKRPDGQVFVRFFDSRGARDTVIATGVSADGTRALARVSTSPTFASGVGKVDVYVAADKISNQMPITFLDSNPPVTTITAPPAGNIQTGDFAVTATDVDDTTVNSCFYSTSTTVVDVTNFPKNNILLSNPYTSSAFEHDIATSASGVSLATWSSGGGNPGTIGQLINPDGTLRGGNIVLGGEGFFNGNSKIAYDADDDLFFVAWTAGPASGGTDADYKIHGTLVKPDGTLVKKDFIAIDYPNCKVGGHTSSFEKVAYSQSAKKFYAACSPNPSGSIVLNSVTPDGTTGNPVSFTANGEATSVAAGPNNTLVTWLDYNTKIGYGRLVNYDGSFATAVFQISGPLPAYGRMAAFNISSGYEVFYWDAQGRTLKRRTVSATGVLGSESTIAIGSNTGVSDIYQYGNSYFVADQHGSDGGNGYLEIKDGVAGSSYDVAERPDLPHYSPAISVVNGVPVTAMVMGGGGVFVQFGSLSGSSAPSNGKTRTCNTQFTVKVPDDCPVGICTVQAWARDTAGNTGSPDSRTFNVKTVITNITYPLAGSYQSRDFSVSVQDRSYTNSNMTCSYDIYSIGASQTKTIDNAERQCNRNFTVTVGPDGDCRDMGENSCRVIVRAVDNTSNSDTAERFFSVDWITPVSYVFLVPGSWVSSDFQVGVIDTAPGSVITQCQYRVVSNGTETVPWRNRSCSVNNSEGVTQLSIINITVGANKNCRHEGGAACTVFVRPLDRSGLSGFGDNASIPIIFNVTNTDGFATMNFVTTERGINFSGTTRQELRTATFYVCNRNSNVEGCIAAYRNNNRGINSQNYCGSPLGLGCELRCSDQNVGFYFAARGVPVGSFETVTAISPIMTAACPTFNIADINRLLALFRQLDQDLAIQRMETDTFIQIYGESATANNETLDILDDAILLTRDHLNYMNVTMGDLTTTRAQEIIARSNTVLDRINALLNRIAPATRVRFTVDVGATVRFNRSVSLPTTTTVTGNLGTYGRVSCSITRPNGNVSRTSSQCLGLSGSTPYSVPFFSDRLGTWQYSCTLARSTRNDCSFEVNRTPVTGSFSVLPGFDTYIDSISGPNALVRGQSAVINAIVKNPDETDKYANVRCDFIDPLNFVRRNTSGCISVEANSQETASVRMIADRLGNWTASRCAVFASQFPGCAGAVQDNVSQQTVNYSVILPNDIFIESVSLPGTVTSGSAAILGVNVQNPTAISAFVNVTCTVSSPSSTAIISDTDGIEGNSFIFLAPNVTANIAGVWNVTECATYKSASPDFSGATRVYTITNVGSFSVVDRLNLTISSVSFPATVANNTPLSLGVSITNPSTARYARVTCQLRNPANTVVSNSSACTLVSGSATIPIGLQIDRTGTWNINSCSVFGSVRSDCTQSSLHDIRINAGSFISSPTTNTSCLNCTNTTNVGIVSVSAPSEVVNNSNVNIDVTAGNPMNDDRFAFVSCSVRTPNVTTRVLTSACAGIQAHNTQIYRTSIFADSVGTWNVTTCSVSAGISCEAASLQQSLGIGRTFNVVRGINLSFVSFVMPPDTSVNNTAVVGVNVRNPSDTARFARVFCSFRTPSNQITSNSTGCTQISGTAVSRYNINIFANSPGTWSVDTCTLRGSLTADCADFHDSEQNAGTFNVTTTAPVGVSSIYIRNISSVGAATNNTMATVVINAVNPGTASVYANTACVFSDGQSSYKQASSCLFMQANSTQAFTVSQLVNRPVTWTVGSCSINASTSSNCIPSSLQNVSSQTAMINVSTPTNLYITSVAAPDADIANNSNVAIDVFVNNPMNDDRFGFVNCVIQDPFGGAQQKSAPCAPVPRQSGKRYNVSVFANLVGAWSVRNCSVSSSTNTDCSSAAVTDDIVNGDIFRVIRGYNLTFSSLSAAQPAYSGRPVDVSYQLRNPSTADRFARVTCSMTRSGQNLTNTSSCFFLESESLAESRATFVPSTTGNWTISCAAERSFDSLCSAVERQDMESTVLEVIQAPNLYIQSIDVASIAALNVRTDATIRIRNTAQLPTYAFAGCRFTNRLNETVRNVSGCANATADSTVVSVSIFPQLRGNWTVSNCFVNVSQRSDCNQSTLHNVSPTIKSFVVTAPLVSIDSVIIPDQSFVVGDLVDIGVNLNNTAESSVIAFVNCTLSSPTQRVYMLTSPNQTIPIGETRTYHLQKIIDETGRWRVGTCSAFTIHSPPSLQSQKVINKEFNVTQAPSQDQCSDSSQCPAGYACQSGQCVQQPPSCNIQNCPGSDSGCYCSGGQCVACGSGYSCQNARCAQQVVINTCRSSAECSSGQECINGVCQERPPECFADTDCTEGTACKSGTCVPNQPLSQNMIILLIIIFAVIMIPVILFIYIRSSLS